METPFIDPATNFHNPNEQPIGSNPVENGQPTHTIVQKEQALNPSYSHDGRRRAIGHWLCHKYVSLFLAIFIFFAALSQLICEIAVYPYTNDYGVRVGPRVAIYIPMILCIIYYLILVFSCGTFKYLWNNMSVNEIYNWMDMITKIKPVISMSVSCYHYETRVEHYTDSQGRSQTRTTTVRVNTYSETRLFNYDFFRDLSRPFVLEGTSKKYMKLQLANVIFTNDSTTKTALDGARLSIQVDNRWRDVHMDYSENWTVPGFKKQILAKMEDKTSASYFFNMFSYIILSIFLMNSLYRIIFDYYCDTQEYQVVKEVSVLPFPEEMIVLTPTLWMNSNYGSMSYGEAVTFNTQFKQEYVPPKNGGVGDQPTMNQPGIPYPQQNTGPLIQSPQPYQPMQLGMNAQPYQPQTIQSYQPYQPQPSYQPYPPQQVFHQTNNQYVPPPNTILQPVTIQNPNNK